MMSEPRPAIECDQQHPTISAADVRAAVEFYTTRLGFTSDFFWGDPPSFAGVTLGSQQIYLRAAPPAPDGCALNFVVGNVDELYAYHRSTGVEIVAEIGDREYGMRDYGVRDLNGYRLGFAQNLFTSGPPIEIERVDVPVRLERRLAALLQDLAAYKRMTVSSCLEETLLHTLEGVGPHTASDLRTIAALRTKHGIDYDSHASYRFVERR